MTGSLLRCFLPSRAEDHSTPSTSGEQGRAALARLLEGEGGSEPDPGPARPPSHASAGARGPAAGGMASRYPRAQKNRHHTRSAGLTRDAWRPVQGRGARSRRQPRGCAPANPAEPAISAIRVKSFPVGRSEFTAIPLFNSILGTENQSSERPSLAFFQSEPSYIFPSFVLQPRLGEDRPGIISLTA